MKGKRGAGGVEGGENPLPERARKVGRGERSQKIKENFLSLTKMCMA